MALNPSTATHFWPDQILKVHATGREYTDSPDLTAVSLLDVTLAEDLDAQGIADLRRFLNNYPGTIVHFCSIIDLAHQLDLVDLPIVESAAVVHVAARWQEQQPNDEPPRRSPA